MITYLKGAIPVAILAVMSGFLYADVGSSDGLGGDQHMRWGPFKASTALGIRYLSTNNLYNRKSDKRSGSTWIVTPSFNLSGAHSPALSYDVGVSVEDGTVNNDLYGDDDYTDWNFTGNANYKPTARAGLNFAASLKKGHEARGTGLSESEASNKPDEYDRSNLGATFTYGVADAKGQLAFNLSRGDLKYTTNKPRTRYSNRATVKQGMVFRWRIAPKTRLLTDIRYASIEYDKNRPGAVSRDSDETSFYLGAAWQATNKTSGSVRLGKTSKDFDDRKDPSASSWEVDVTWKPRSYSSLGLGTSRSYQETSGLENAILNTDYTVSWAHQWRPRVSTKLGYSRANQEYTGGAKRTDKSNAYRISASYDMRRWLKLNGGYTIINRNSSRNDLDYDKNNWYLGLSVRF